jgi:hypothetical protein
MSERKHHAIYSLPTFFPHAASNMTFNSEGFGALSTSLSSGDIMAFGFLQATLREERQDP